MLAGFLIFLLSVTSEDTQESDVWNDSDTESSFVPLEDQYHDPESSLPLIDSDIEEAMEQLSLEKNEEGRRYVERQKYPEALEAFEKAYDLNPDNAEIVNNLGYVYFLLGNLKEAEFFIRRSIEIDDRRAVAYLNLCDVLAKKDKYDKTTGSEISALLTTARQLLGNSPRVILRQARHASNQKDYTAARRFYDEYIALRKPSQRLRLELGDFYRDMGQPSQALVWYRGVSDENLRSVASERIWDIEVEEQNVSLGWTPLEVSKKARNLASNASTMVRNRQYDDAQRLYLEALTISPVFTGAMVELADLYYRTDRLDEAETLFLRALVIDRDNPDIYARLGRILLYRGGRLRSAEATVYLSRALDLRPKWLDVEFELALALRDKGDPIGALKHVNSFLSQVGDDEKRTKRALNLKRTLELLVPPAELINLDMDDGNPSLMEDVSPELIEALRSVRIYLERGQLDSAMARLRTLDDENRGPTVLNLEARILIGAGLLEEAVDALLLSLKRNEDQPMVYEQLGMVYLDLGQEKAARIHFEKAEKSGDTAAAFFLARMDAQKSEGKISVIYDIVRVRQIRAALERVKLFVSHESSSPFRHEAKELEQELKNRLKYVFYLLSLISGILIFSLFFFWFKLYGGIDLKRLISDCPESGVYIQRLLSAIRHEVLKHNTMMLVGLVDIMKKAEDAGDKVEHFRMKMLGKDGVSNRLFYYIEELRRVGRMHKKRLNLTKKDSAISPLYKGMHLIINNKKRLKEYDSLSDSARNRLLRDLQLASALLNVEGYEAVRALLERLRTLKVDKNLLTGIYHRCKSESSFAGYNFLKLELVMSTTSGLGLDIAVPRAAFEDIVTNIIRNAIQSSILYGPDKEVISIGLEVRDETDMVTGLERMILLVKDRSKRELTPEMLRGRYIEEGLGLTADLVTMYDGTLDVMKPCGEWEKAVVVKLPLSEAEGQEEQDGA